MGEYIVSRVAKLMINKKMHVVDSKILILGLTFKENCPDLRNTRVIDMIKELQEYHADVDVYDPWVNPEEAVHEYNIQPVQELVNGTYDAIIIAVSHNEFKTMGIEKLRQLCKPKHVIYDVKYTYGKNDVDERI